MNSYSPLPSYRQTGFFSVYIKTICTLFKNWLCVLFCLWERGWVNRYFSFFWILHLKKVRDWTRWHIMDQEKQQKEYLIARTLFEMTRLKKKIYIYNVNKRTMLLLLHKYLKNSLSQCGTLVGWAVWDLV